MTRIILLSVVLAVLSTGAGVALAALVSLDQAACVAGCQDQVR